MWYQVPETKPTPAEPPKPIFPWEREADRPKATRVFAEDLASPPPEPTPAPAPTHPFSTVHYDEGGSSPPQGPERTSPPRAASPQTAEEQWQSFQQNASNAWDAVPGIDTYVRAIMGQQTKRGKPQVLAIGGYAEEVMSPSAERKNRRESLILTDFPSAVDRPSLPVTPAPVRRPTFWGEERNETGELPTAEGVPDQAEWVSIKTFICPSCGFSSKSEHDFSSSQGGSTFVSAITTPAPSLSIAITTAATSVPEPGAPTETELPEATPMTTWTSMENEPQYLPGFSARGAPLASLTNPSMYIQTSSPKAELSEPTSPVISAPPASNVGISLASVASPSASP